MTHSLFDEIRDACARIVPEARWVQIDTARIARYVATLPLEGAISPVLDPAHHYLADIAGTAAFVLTLDAINFGSGYFPHLHKRPGMSGYFTVATSLTERFHQFGPYSAAELAALTPVSCAAVFRQPADDGPRDELMGLFSCALNDLGNVLLERFDGSFTALVEFAGGSAEALVRTLSTMPYFRDVMLYRGSEVPFYKRAQLTAADLALALGSTGLGDFHDLDRLTIFADNLVPHVLRVDGILRYDDTLAARIDAGELLTAGSEEEVEIRAAAVHAVELMAKALASSGHSVTPHGLDYLLWNRGQQPYYKARPRHRARSVFY